MHWNSTRLQWVIAAAIKDITTKGIDHRYSDREYGNDTRKLEVMLQDTEPNSKEIMERAAKVIFEHIGKFDEEYVDVVRVYGAAGVKGTYSRRK